MALYAGAIAVVDVIWAILSQVDVLIMGVFLSPAAVASFQAPSRLLSLATYPGLALSNALGPRLASERSTSQTLVTTARRLVVIQAFAATICLLYARQIVHIALGASYVHTAAPSVVRVLAPFVMLSGLAPLLSNAIDYVGGARRRAGEHRGRRQGPADDAAGAAALFRFGYRSGNPIAISPGTNMDIPKWTNPK